MATSVDIIDRITDSPEATQALGAELARSLQAGDVVTFSGDLGAGKTHLIKGLCAAFGVPEPAVSSPTFTLVNQYDTPDGLVIYHIDAYRIKHVDEFHELGYEEYVYGDGLCLIEWPERVASLIPPGSVPVQIDHLGEQRRRIRWEIK
ncbi:MAG: tRNA (adenosine(37)-N6)-threonylcarbamoyltransferase complex ATPase subunit type 1 TsaE [Bacteroidota bacterium]